MHDLAAETSRHCEIVHVWTALHPRRALTFDTVMFAACCLMMWFATLVPAAFRSLASHVFDGERVLVARLLVEGQASASADSGTHQRSDPIRS